MDEPFAPSIGAIREAEPECSIGAITTPEALEEGTGDGDGRPLEDQDSAAERQPDDEPTD